MSICRGPPNRSSNFCVRARARYFGHCFEAGRRQFTVYPELCWDARPAPPPGASWPRSRGPPVPTAARVRLRPGRRRQKSGFKNTRGSHSGSLGPLKRLPRGPRRPDLRLRRPGRTRTRSAAGPGGPRLRGPEDPGGGAGRASNVPDRLSILAAMHVLSLSELAASGCVFPFKHCT
jgi:hypothetical protein